MNRDSDKSLRLFVNPFGVWAEAVLKTGQAMLESMQAAARASRASVASVPTGEAPPKRARAKPKRKPKAKPKTKAKPKRKSRR